MTEQARLQQQIEARNQEWDTLVELLRVLRDDLHHETRSEEKFRIQYVITKNEQALEDIEQHLATLEQQLAAIGEAVTPHEKVADADQAEQDLSNEATVVITELLRQCQLSERFQARDEFSVHNSDNLKLIRELREAIEQLPTDTPGYHALAIRTASALSSAGQLEPAETLLTTVQAEGTPDEQALAAFNRFHLHLRQGDFETALVQLQLAIRHDARRYALHDTGKYPIERLLGAGGMGCVFLCQGAFNVGKVVVKCFWEAMPGPKEAVFKEAFIMRQLPHDYFPKVYDYDYVDSFAQERPYIITEYIPDALDGEQWLATHGALNLVDSLAVGLQISRALALAHDKGVYHLDLKPANLLLRRVDGEMQVKIIDFGLSKVAKSLKDDARSRQHRSGLSMMGQAVFGTLDYAPPEQLGDNRYGSPGAKSDLFAFGKTLYRLATEREASSTFRRQHLADWPAELFELLGDCVEQDPADRPETASVLVTAFEQVGQPATDTSADDDVDWIGLGNTLGDQGKWDEAIDAYQQQVALEPEHAWAWYHLGNALRQQNRLDDAVKAYRRQLTVNPTHEYVWGNLGSVLRQQGQLDEAIEAHRQQLAVKPDDEHAWYNLGNALSDRGDLDEAIDAYRRHVEIKPDDPYAWNNLGNVLREQGKFAEAETACRQQIEVVPDHEYAWNNLGNALLGLNRLDEAVAAYRKQIDINPADEFAWNNLGNVLRQQGKLDQAVAAYRKQLDLTPNDQNSHSALQQVLAEQQRQQHESDAEIEPGKPAAKPNYALIVFIVMLVLGVLRWGFYVQPTPSYAPLALAAEKAAKVRTFRDKLKDGSDGPLMAVIPAGSFRMGNIQGGGDSGERPVHSVQLDSFAMGVYEVTFEEYDKFADATNRSKPDDEGWGRGKRPVINVSWEDATAYANWLSRQAGQRYRLPTEAEWEYAARAGTETNYWWGNEVGDRLANCAGYAQRTSPAGSFRVNPFGLHDTAGNVYEWVQDWYGSYSRSRAVNPAGPATGDLRVLRGGAWYHIAQGCRSASRAGFDPSFRTAFVGFRLARTNP